MPIILSTLPLIKLKLSNLLTLTLTITTMMALLNIPNSHHNPNLWTMNDMISLPLSILTIFITLLIILSSNSPKKFTPMLIIIMTTLLVTFNTNDPLTFYISFELVLIPTFMIITTSGKQPERLQASLYLLMYTIFASLPLLMALISIYHLSSFTFMYTNNTQFSYAMLFLAAFLVKLPMFSTHLWLPKAHVEAPMEGSMILAAILLKLGGYGMIRMTPMLLKSSMNINPWIITISLLGASLTGLICTRQKDLKALIAYSSVSHMAFTIIALMTLLPLAPKSAMLMMVSHGLSSSALFLLVTIIYSQTHSRNTLTFKGLLHTNPTLTLWTFILIAMNIAAPPTINLASEILIIMTSLTWNTWTLIPLFIPSITTLLFSILIYTAITHNNPSSTPKMPSQKKHYLTLSLHTIPSIMFIIKMNILML